MMAPECKMEENRDKNRDGRNRMNIGRKREQRIKQGMEKEC